MTFCQIRHWTSNPLRNDTFCREVPDWALAVRALEPPTCAHCACDCPKTPLSVQVSPWKQVKFPGGRCYPWAEAQCYCLGKGGRLWEPESAQEYNTVARVAREAGYFQGMSQKCGWWTGLLNFADVDQNIMRLLLTNVLPCF